jgi:hypothetical protein
VPTPSNEEARKVVGLSSPHMLSISLDLAASHWRKVERPPMSARLPHDKSASFALVTFSVSDKLPSERRSRYMPGHRASGTTRVESMLGRLSVTKTRLPAAGISGWPVTLTNALVPFVGAVEAPLDAFFLQVAPQN